MESLERGLITTVVGSYPQPGWLIDREMILSRVPRVRAREMWRVPDAYLEEAQDDATIVAIHEMEQAGIDVVSDGEIRRESYTNQFATALEGLDIENPGILIGRGGRRIPVPRIVGPIRHGNSVLDRDVRFAKQHASRPLKITVPGPFTLIRLSQNEYYPDDESAAMAYAAAVNAELRAMKAAGADMVQIDEPSLQGSVEEARRYAIPAINAALEGISGPKLLHSCFGYPHKFANTPIAHERLHGYPFLSELEEGAVTHIAVEAAQENVDVSIFRGLPNKTIILGVINLSDESPVETPEEVADRVRRALEVIPAERLWLAPDCGMKFLSREVAFGKLRALANGVAMVRGEVGLAA
jgi:5-methyltetrahydropteroyltriglutamate--homocysteine methyltransferase